MEAPFRPVKATHFCLRFRVTQWTSEACRQPGRGGGDPYVCHASPPKRRKVLLNFRLGIHALEGLSYLICMPPTPFLTPYPRVHLPAFFAPSLFSKVCDEALLLAASRSNISFALEMCEHMEMSGLSPSRAVRRRLKDAVALITYGPKAGHADAEDLDSYLSAWEDDHDSSLEEENYNDEDDSDAEDIIFEVTDVRAESGDPMHDGIDVDVHVPGLNGDYYEEDAAYKVRGWMESRRVD